ncbi:unnamed protein product [Cercospora beticola]|nr:unnamed protein product [Cercospora beticola]
MLGGRHGPLEMLICFSLMEVFKNNQCLGVSTTKHSSTAYAHPVQRCSRLRMSPSYSSSSRRATSLCAGDVLPFMCAPWHRRWVRRYHVKYEVALGIAHARTCEALRWQHTGEDM